MTHLAVDVPGRTRAPWHLWLVGILAALWYASGLYVFVMARRGTLAMPPDEADYYATMAGWEILACMPARSEGWPGHVVRPGRWAPMARAAWAAIFGIRQQVDDNRYVEMSEQGAREERARAGALMAELEGVLRTRGVLIDPA